ncbi:MAG: hypothetical protein CM15mP54_28250 [Paracoccaceae bacterium]|nr:MAG: hypothetical protein CM15mP54_28250 [Paracoccaceae bacterium]
MRDQGIFFSGNKILHNLSCTEHTQADIDASIGPQEMHWSRWHTSERFIMTDHKIYEMPFADVFSHYVAKVNGKA